jgi:predicted P-loop ATPase
VWEQRVATYLADQSETTVSDIAQHALFIETPRVSTTDRNRITAILEALGWRRGPRSGSRRPWIPPLRPPGA